MEAEEIDQALRKSTNRKTPGKDEIPYELYKMRLETRKNEKTPNIAYILTQVYNSVETHGVLDERFAEGVMCLL